jgi:toxin FitB
MAPHAAGVSHWPEGTLTRGWAALRKPYARAGPAAQTFEQPLTRYLLDTNIVSELRKNKPHGAVVGWFSALHSEQIFVSAVTLGEMQSGVEIVRLQDSLKAAEIESWVDKIAATVQILSIDSACFREWGRMMHGKSDYLIEDAMIAATARVHGLTVVSRNERDFEQLGIAVLNPFKTPRKF